MNSKVDLHMHSKASDGSDWIPGLLRKIQKLGIRTFALTDHDTIKGVQRMEKIVPDGIRFIRGIELSCKTEVAKCHILGYNYDLKQKEFLDFVAEAYGVRINKTHNRLRYMEEEFGFRFTAEEKEAQLKNPGKLQLKLLLEKKLRQLHPGAEPVDIFATYFKNLPSGRVEQGGRNPRHPGNKKRRRDCCVGASAGRHGGKTPDKGTVCRPAADTERRRDRGTGMLLFRIHGGGIGNAAAGSDGTGASDQRRQRLPRQE